MLIFNRKRLVGAQSYKQTLPADVSLLWYMWLSPIVVLVVLSLVFGVGLRDMWGMPMWALSGLLAASFIKPAAQAITAIKLRKALVMWLTLTTVLMIVYVGFGDKIRHKPSRMHWPEQALATQAQESWQSLSHCPLDSVSGDRWLGALVAMNNNFPSQMISGPASHSPWMSAERIQKHGTLVIWQDGDDNDMVLPLLDVVNVSSSHSKNSINNKNTMTNTNVLIKKQGQWQVAWPDANASEPLIVKWVAYVPTSCLITN